MGSQMLSIQNEIRGNSEGSSAQTRRRDRGTYFKIFLPLIVCCFLVIMSITTLMVGQRQPRRWDYDYDYLRSEYFADYVYDEDYEGSKDVIVRKGQKKPPKETFNNNSSNNKDDLKV